MDAEENTNATMTMADLKAALDALTPEQLAMPARWWGDERGGAVVRLDVLEEDYLDGGEGCCPRSAFGDVSPEDEAEGVGRVVFKAGTPILAVD